MYHEQYEQVPENSKIVLCDCGNLIYMYPTKSGSEMPVTILEGMRFHRFGNYNNNVPIHECSGDRRTSEFCHAIKIQIESVPEDIASKVTGNLQQQAVIKALRDFSKPRTRSGFKKSMLKQATDYIAGNSTYHNPYSQKQALAIILGR
jgi:hypothetical protein